MAQYDIIRPATREEWLKERRKGIGASDIAALLGLSPWVTPYQLWQDKTATGEVEDKLKDDPAVIAGHMLEDAVAQYYQLATGRHVIKASAGDWLAVNPYRPWMRCSPDRTFFKEGKGGQKGILECKTTRHPLDPNDLPKHYYLQLQWQMGITGMHEGALAWLASGMTFDYARVTFDRNLFEQLTATAEEWWQKHVVDGVAPDPTTADEVRLAYPVSTAASSVATEEAVAAYHRLKDIKANVKALEEEAKGLEDIICKEIGGNEALVVGDKTGGVATLATFKSGERTTFDSKAFKAADPDTYVKYCKTTTCRTLRLK